MPTKKQRLAQLQGDWTASEIRVTYKPAIRTTKSITKGK